MDRFREDAGRRLLPHIIDELGEGEPERIVYEIPVNSDLNLPFTKVTARNYANAINRASWWFHDMLGIGEGFPTVGYTGPQDIRYFILLVSAIKTGYKMLYTSPRNTVEGDVAVIRAANCNIWLVPSRGSNVERLSGHISLRTVPLPDLEYFLNPDPVLLYQYTKTWETGKRDPSWVLHTSGSTGNPKPVVRFLDSVASVGANNLLSRLNGRPLLLHDYYDTRVYLTFPLYHGAGLVNGMLWPLFHGTTVIFGPERPISLDLMKQVTRQIKPDAIFTAPSIVEEISKDDDFLDLLQTVNALAYGGGPVSLEAGNRIWKYTKLRLSIGTTETGWLPCVETDPEDWNYIHLHPDSGFEFQDRGAGLYELVSVRKAGLEQWQPIFSTFPELQEYNFKDLFSRHPTKPGLHKYEGRADNILVLSNGEKVQPHDMELVIGAHPLVTSVVIAGQGRFQTSAIIEVLERAQPASEVERQDLINRLWSSIEMANKSAPTHARLHRGFIIIALPERPFPRTSKATVRRGPTIQLYEEELNKIYHQAESRTNGHEQLFLNFDDRESLKQSLRNLILIATDLPSIETEQDFFAVAGIDSLQVLNIRRAIARNIPKDGILADNITTSLIYGNPTTGLLSHALFGLYKHSLESVTGQGERSSRVAPDLLSKYTKSLPSPSQSVSLSSAKKRNHRSMVVLTGSTGSLGSYLLHELLESEYVSEIWCLNRSAEAATRQLSINRARGLSTNFEPNRIKFRHATLSKDRLGLSEIDYRHLVQNATHVVDVQWQVDFNLAIESFEPHIRGVRNLINLVSAGSKAGNSVKLFFTSSVGVANNVSPSQKSIPETILTDWTSASSGYGESKLVAERLLLEAAEKSEVDVTICRVGQIAGPVKASNQKGQWNPKEWFPSIIDASAYLSMIPEKLGRNESIDWIPVDLLASIVLELAAIKPPGPGDHQTSHGQIVHAVNPSKVQWHDALLPVIAARLALTSKTTSMEIVPLTEWVEALKSASSVASEKEEASISAFKLVPFLSALAQGATRPTFETTNTAKLSKGLRQLEAVGENWANVWLTQWGY